MILNENYLRKVVRESIHKVLTEDENMNMNQGIDYKEDIMNCELNDFSDFISYDGQDITLIFTPTNLDDEYFYEINLTCGYKLEDEYSEPTPLIYSINSILFSDDDGVTKTPIDVEESKDLIKFLKSNLKFDDEIRFEKNDYRDWYDDDLANLKRKGLA